MPATIRVLLLACVVCTTGSCTATRSIDVSQSWEQEVRAAERRHVEAFLAEDVAALEGMLSEDFVVNSPRNSVIERDQLLEMVRGGSLSLSEFTQEIERVRRFGDVVVVMGRDRVTYAAPSPDAGQAHERRFTDVWRRDGGGWKFFARQASLVCR